MEQNTKNTALLVMDMQMGILGNYPHTKEAVSKVAAAIAKARDNKMPVIYVVVGFRKGAPEVSANNKGFGARKEAFSGINMDDFMKVHADIAPIAGDITITKRRVSAFTGSDLEVILRAQGIQHIVLTGISTSGVVLSTLREAADKDYRITVLADCCFDPNPEVHRILTTEVFTRQADVVMVDEWKNV